MAHRAAPLSDPEPYEPGAGGEGAAAEEAAPEQVASPPPGGSSGKPLRPTGPLTDEQKAHCAAPLSDPEPYTP